MGEVPTIKAEALRMIAALPDDVTLEDIQYHLYVVQQIQQGMRDLEEGRVISHEEVQQRLAKWLAG